MFFTILFPTGLDPDSIKSASELTVKITSDRFNTLLSSLVSEQEGVGSLSAFGTINVILEPGITLGASTTSNYALWIDDGIPAGTTVVFTNNGGVVMGAGGDGGKWSATTGEDGEDGGTAIFCSRDCTIVNTGVIAGGGGGGGGGNNADPIVRSIAYQNGGGGAGEKPGLAGRVTLLSGGDSNQGQDATKWNPGFVTVTSSAGRGGYLGANGAGGDESNGGDAGMAIDFDGNTVTYTDNTVDGTKGDAE